MLGSRSFRLPLPIKVMVVTPRDDSFRGVCILSDKKCRYISVSAISTPPNMLTCQPVDISWYDHRLEMFDVFFCW